MLISLQYNSRQDSSKAACQAYCNAPQAHFQPGKDIAAPPTTSQEDGFLNKVNMRDLRRYSPFFQEDWTKVVTNRTYVRLLLLALASSHLECTL
jgi:hypothetical protein